MKKESPAFTGSPFRAVSVLIGLLLIVFMGELLPVIYGGDLGAFLWTSIHFVLNPLLCLAYIVFAAFQVFHTGSKQRRLLYLSLLVLPILYIYVLLSDPAGWVRILGLSFPR